MLILLRKTPEASTAQSRLNRIQLNLADGEPRGLYDWFAERITKSPGELPYQLEKHFDDDQVEGHKGWAFLYRRLLDVKSDSWIFHPMLTLDNPSLVEILTNPLSNGGGAYAWGEQAFIQIVSLKEDYDHSDDRPPTSNLKGGQGKPPKAEKKTPHENPVEGAASELPEKASVMSVEECKEKVRLAERSLELARKKAEMSAEQKKKTTKALEDASRADSDASAEVELTKTSQEKAEEEYLDWVKGLAAAQEREAKSRVQGRRKNDVSLEEC